MGDAAKSGFTIAEAEARLYTAPLATFAEARKKLAAELRAAGAPDAAKELAARKKPSRAAWALNHVAHYDPAEIAAFLGTTGEVRDAEAKAKRDRSMPDLAEAGKTLQAAIAKLVARCAKAVESDGAKMTGELERALGRALHAVPFARAADLEALTRGTLTTELEEPEDAALFGGDDAGAFREAGDVEPVAVAPPPARSEKPTRRDDTAAAEAKAALAKTRLEEEQRAAAAAEAARLSREADKREAEALRADERAKRAEREAEEATRYAKEVQARAAVARREADDAMAAAREARHLADGAR
jgi:hypothetical protein